MSGIFSKPKVDTSSQKRSLRLQEEQAEKLNAEERSERQATAAQKRSMRGRMARGVGSNQTLFGGDYLGIPKNG